MAGKLNTFTVKKVRNNFISNCTYLLVDAYNTSISNKAISQQHKYPSQ